MKEVKLLIKEELRKQHARQEYVINSYSLLNESTNDTIINDYLNVTTKLIDEGYQLSELDIVLEQNLLDRLSSGFKSGAEGGGISDMAKKTWDKTNVAGAISGGLMSGLKEKIILGILNFLGIKGGFVKSLVVAFNDYDIRDILKPFKSKEYCVKYGPPMIDSIIEVIMSSAMEKNLSTDFNSFTDVSNVSRVGIRNIIAQAEKQSNFGELVSNKFCSIVWK